MWDIGRTLNAKHRETNDVICDVCSRNIEQSKTNDVTGLGTGHIDICFIWSKTTPYFSWCRS